MKTPIHDTRPVRLAGASVIAGSLGFVAVFSYLASRFDYPEVLDGEPARVLPALLSGGTELRTVWFVYGALPLFLGLAGIGGQDLFARRGPALARLGTVASIVATVSMMVGLLRWPTIQWALARSWAAADEPQRLVIGAMFDAANAYLGNTFGELIGEVAMYTWLAASAVAILRGVGIPRVIGWFTLVTSAMGLVGALRNVTDAVDVVADINNATLPITLIVFGIGLVRHVDTRGPELDG